MYGDLWGIPLVTAGLVLVSFYRLIDIAEATPYFIILWLFMINIFDGINSVGYGNNTDVSMPGWCDTSTLLLSPPPFYQGLSRSSCHVVGYHRTGPAISFALPGHPSRAYYF